MSNFNELGLNDYVVKAVTELGFENPTPIQQETIPYILGNKTDLIGLAQTGTGKTAAFGLPIINNIDFSSRLTQALIIAPTRELCIQICNDLKKYTKYCQGANIVPIYGGASILVQIQDINRGAQVVVATPGRMVDMIDRRKVNLSNVKYLVLDEADEMLNMGFKEDLDKILDQTPKEKQTLLFSATMPSEVSRIAKKYMNNPHEIAVAKQSQSAENIEHLYFEVHERDRYLALKRIIDNNPDIFGIVFCRTKYETQDVADKLIKDGYNADSLHGDLSQSQRDYVMKRYRSKTLQLLVATDVAARGIDVNNVTHVLNYNLPDDSEIYTHRSGRTARAGRSGVSLVIVNMREIGKLRGVERVIGKRFIKAQVPTGFEICGKQLLHLVKRIHDANVNEGEIEKYMTTVNELMADISKEELIKKIVSTEFNRFLDYYKNAPDLNATTQPRKQMGLGNSSSEGGGLRLNSSGMQRMFINVGEVDGFQNRELAEYVADLTQLNQNDITQISIRDKYSFFNVAGEAAPKVLASFKDEKFKGRPVRVDITEDRNGGPTGGGERRGSGRRDGGSDSRSGSGERRSYGGGGNRGGDSRGSGSGAPRGGRSSSPYKSSGSGDSYKGGNSGGSSEGSSRERVMRSRKKY